MVIINGYAELEDLTGWIINENVDNADILENVVTSVSRWIDQYCQRHFYQQTATARVFDACSPYRVKFGAFNDLVSVTTLKTDSNADGTFETTWSASDYQLLPRNTAAAETRPYNSIRSLGTRIFPIPTGYTTRDGLIEITGTWGWPAVPAAVKEACLMQSSRIYKRRYSPDGVAGFNEYGVVRVAGKLDSDVADMLDPYRRSPLLVA